MPKIITIKLKDYQLESVQDTVRYELERYDDPRLIIGDIYYIVSLLEALYNLGDKKNAKELLKVLKMQIKDGIRCGCEGFEKEDAKSALEELKNVDFARKTTTKSKK